jgi:hypothetical protein
MQQTFSIMTTASQEKVWDMSTDVQNWKQWIPEIKEAHLNGRFDENAEGVLIPENGRKTVFKVKSCKPNFSFTLLAKLPLAQMYLRRMIGYHNQKTMVTQEIWIEGPLSGFWWRLLGKRYQQMMPQNLERFRALAECR